MATLGVQSYTRIFSKKVLGSARRLLPLRAVQRAAALGV